MDETPSFPIRDVWNLLTRHLGRVVTVFHETDSTNTRAADAARRGRAESQGHAFLADRQSSGRGQYGRSWHAPAGSAVLLSLVLHPPAELARPAILTAWTAVSVRNVIGELTGIDCSIKWPNDLLIARKKVCGILIEQGVPGQPSASIAGIGLNVNQQADDFARANLPAATSLAMTAGRRFDSDEVARRLIARLDQEYDQIQRGDIRSLESAWAIGLGLLGKEVVADCAGSTYQGRLIEAAFSGVILDRIGKTPLVLLPESILHLREA